MNSSSHDLSLLVAVLSSMLIAISNTFEAVSIHYILDKYGKIQNPLLDKDGMVKLFFVAPLGCLIAALLGPLALIFFGIAESDVYRSMMWTWWIGDLTGIMVFVPLILVFSSKAVRVKRKLYLEFILFLISLSIVSSFVFLPFDVHFLDEKPMIYTLLPFFVWGIYRFELAGATILVLVLYVFSVFFQLIWRLFWQLHNRQPV